MGRGAPINLLCVLAKLSFELVWLYSCLAALMTCPQY